MRRAAAALALGAGLLGPAVRAQAPAPSPPPPPEARVFPAGIEQVTVDVVVLDRQGRVVPGLTREDFTVLDEGKAQEIQTFEVVQPPAAGVGAVPAPGPGARPRLATNTVVPGARGRQFVIVFDDIHLTPVHAQAAKAAVAAFLEKGAQEGDRVLLAATGGGAWWTTRLTAGRADLLGVLKALEGRRLLDNAGDRLTDFEAMRIFVYHDAPVALRVMARLDRYGGTSRQDMQANRERTGGTDLAGIIDPYIELRASEAYFKLKSRMDLTLRVLGRALRSLDDTKERKAVILVSEGFVNDPSNPALQQVTEAARRANAAIYFIDTRGLQALSLGYSAEFGPPLPDQDRMAAIADVSTEGEGAVSLASDTGGFSVRNTNDFAAGTVRVGRESSSYYLLGYNPGAIVRDGKFRKLEVKVRGRGYSVRARRGYYALPEGESASASAAMVPKGTDPVLQRALDAPGVSDGVPLNLTAFVQQAAGARHARVTLAAEADVSAVGAREVEGRQVATLETLLVVQHRDSGEMQRRDQTVQLELRPAPPGQPVWYAFTREVELPAGVQQARLIVRDTVRKRVGSVVLDFEVPPLDGLRVSTPVLADRLLPTLDGTLAPALTVRPAFPAGGQLYCGYDVFDAARGPDGRPQVKAGHALRRRGGALVGESAPSPIQPTSIGALSRLIQIPLAGTPPGDYELVLTVEDSISGQKREVVEPVTIGLQPSE
jgi:VWFA-related protein